MSHHDEHHTGLRGSAVIADTSVAGLGAAVTRTAAAATDRSFQSEYTAGMTISVRIVLEIMPPTIGAAMRFMTLAPVPLPQKIGSRPAMIATVVIIRGRMRSTDPSTTAS